MWPHILLVEAKKNVPVSVVKSNRMSGIDLLSVCLYRHFGRKYAMDIGHQCLVLKNCNCFPTAGRKWVFTVFSYGLEHLVFA